MNTLPRIQLDILICTYRRPRELQRLLDSLARAEVPRSLSIQIVIVNNDAPSPISVNIAEHFSQTVLNEAQLGLAFARNRAVAESKGDWSVFLDDDQTVEGDFFLRVWSRAKNIFRKEPYAAVLHKRFVLDGTNAHEAVPHKSSQQPIRASRRTMGTGGFLMNRAFVNQFSGENFFDPLFNCVGAEDTDLFLRAVAKGLRIDYLPTFLVNEHVSSLRQSPSAMIESAKRKGYADMIVDLKHSVGIGWWIRGVLKALGIATFASLIRIPFLFNPTGNLRFQVLMARQTGKLAALLGQSLRHYPDAISDRTLVATQNLKLGGAEKVIVDLVRPVANHQTVLFLYNSDGRDTLDIDCNNQGSICIRHVKRAGFDPAIIIKLYMLSGYLQIKTFHSHDIGALFYGTLLRWLRPKIQTIHSIHTLHTVRNHSRYSWLMRQSLNQARSLAVAVSQSVKDELIEGFGINENKITVVKNGIDVQRFAHTSSNKSDYRQDFRVATVSRISPEKRLENVIMAIHLAKQQGISIHLHHIGSGCLDEHRRLSELAAGLGVGHQIVWHGYVNNVEHYLSGVDVFVSASSEECHPVSVVEAAAAGLNLLLSNIPPHLEFDHLTGVEFFNSSLDLSERLARAYFKRRSASDTNRHERDLRLFGVETMRQKYHDLYTRNNDAVSKPTKATGSFLGSFAKSQFLN